LGNETIEGVLLYKEDGDFAIRCQTFQFQLLENPTAKYFVGTADLGFTTWKEFGSCNLDPATNTFICNLPFKSVKCGTNGRPIQIEARIYSNGQIVDTMKYPCNIFLFEGQKYKQWKKVAEMSNKRQIYLSMTSALVTRA
jgi:hypothetical protein